MSADSSNSFTNPTPSVYELLMATNEIAKVLLENDRLDRGLESALEILGTRIDADRLNVFQHYDDPQGKTLGYIVTRQEWISAGTISQIDRPPPYRIPYDGVENCYYLFNAGQHWGGSIETLSEPFRSGQIELEVKATYAIPIMLEGRYWGVITLDFCRIARLLEDAEIAILKTTAACVGGAIEKERARQANEKVTQERATQLAKHNRVLAKRDRLLAATASAANIISTADDFDLAVNRALEIIGKAIDSDRVTVMDRCDNSSDETVGYVQMLYEWHSVYAVPQLNHPQADRVSYQGIEEWYELMCRGQWAGGLIEELSEPFRSTQQIIGVKSTYAIPIMVEGKYWGILALDNCRQATLLNEAEISVLKTAAASIGGAIAKKRSQQAYQRVIEARATQLEQSNRVLNLRDRWLEATAKAANELLLVNELNAGINAALKVLGESLNCDRVTIWQHIDDSNREPSEFVRLLYEWSTPNVVLQISHPELNEISASGLEDWFVKLKAGDWIGGVIAELKEPFRSTQVELGVEATYSVPILVDNVYWGAIGIDFCREPKRLTEPEIAVFKTAASCMGSAIAREAILLEREEARFATALAEQKASILEERDRILNLTTEVAEVLLDNKSLKRAMAIALEIIGRGINSDRVSVMKHHADGTGASLGYAEMLYEWHSANAVAQLHHPNLHRVGYEGIEDWYRLLVRGEAVGGVVEELAEPVRSGQQKIGVKSTYAIPVMVDGQYWGLVCFDDCRAAIERSKIEISLLKTTAVCIASAIERESSRQEREQAERRILLERQKAAQLAEHNRVLEQRDRLLAATASAANIISTADDFDLAVQRALEIVGESVDTDRVAVMEQHDDPSGETLGFSKMLYEWHSVRTATQLEHPKVGEVSWAGIEDWYELVSRGQWVGGLVEELPEPFRSRQEIIGVKYTYAIPIMVEGKYWGSICLDNCRQATSIGEAEISVLKTAGTSIGGAIEKKRSQQAYQQAIEARAAQLEQSNRVLSIRDRWLEATTNAANKLLEYADLDEGINAALKALGESLDCDRIGVWQRSGDLAGNPNELVRLVYEWSMPDIAPQISEPELSVIPRTTLEDRFLKMGEGDWVGGMVDNLEEPCRSIKQELGAQTNYGVAIFVNGNCWGAFSLDFCRQPRLLTEPEMSVFETAATCMGSAIYRQQIQQEKERAELAILEERNRMAREIHDTLAQAFTGISLQLEAAKSNLIDNPEAAIERLNLAKKLAKEGISEARRSVRALRPEVLELGLAIALEQLGKKMFAGTQIQAKTNIEGEIRFLDPAMEVNLFRIAQEAITNALRHANATEIAIELIYEANVIHLQIKDNGIGFDVDSTTNGFGLMGMQERCDRLNCDLVINSNPEQGTNISVTAPVKPSSRSNE